jgi:hypothetical protein
MKQIVKRYMDCDNRKTTANSSCIIDMVRVLYNIANIKKKIGGIEKYKEKRK